MNHENPIPEITESAAEPKWMVDLANELVSDPKPTRYETILHIIKWHFNAQPAPREAVPVSQPSASDVAKLVEAAEMAECLLRNLGHIRDAAEVDAALMPWRKL